MIEAAQALVAPLNKFQASTVEKTETVHITLAWGFYWSQLYGRVTKRKRNPLCSSEHKFSS